MMVRFCCFANPMNGVSGEPSASRPQGVLR